MRWVARWILLVLVIALLSIVPGFAVFIGVSLAILLLGCGIVWLFEEAIG